MAAGEAEDERAGRELLEAREEVERHQRALFVPVVALPLRAGAEQVVGPGDVGGDLVRLVEERHRARERPPQVLRVDPALAALPVGAAGVAEVVVPELVPEDERELLIHELMLPRDLARVGVLHRIDEAGGRPDDRLIRPLALGHVR